MQRIAVMGLREERPRLLSTLYDLGVMQIEPLSKSAAGFLRAGADSAGGKEVSEELLRVRGLMSALPPTPSDQRRGFGSSEELLNTSRSINIDADVSRLKQAEEKLNGQLDDLRNRIDLVTKLSFVDEDLSIFDLKSVTSFFGTVPAEVHDELVKSLTAIPDALTYSSGKDPIGLIVVVPTQGLEAFGSIIQKADVRLQRIPPMKGKPAEVLSGLEKDKASKESQVAEMNEQLAAISKSNYGLLSSVEEQLAIEARQLEVVNVLGFTDRTFAVEGWVPKRKLSGLEEVLPKLSDSIELFKIEGEGKPPTLMENPKRLKFFESFIRFYTQPTIQSNELDPTLIFAVAFPIFFGFMLGDVGYAVLVLLISIWIIRRVNHPERKTVVPRVLRSFAGRILRPPQFKKLAKAMILGSLVGIVMGFLINTYFGFQENQHLFTYLNANFNLGLPADGTFLNPISSIGLKRLMLYSGYIGLFMVSFGLVLGMVNAYWMDERKHIIGKAGWLATAWGISLTGLALLRHGSVSQLANPVSNPLILLILAGIGLIIYGEGAQAIIELPSIVSNIISYMRLLGILLASYVLAYLIDTQAIGPTTAGTPALVDGGIGYAIMGVVLFVMVHLFNTILGILEPGIQGARLIYVEHFSKYTHGQGRIFTPFKGERTHTLGGLESITPEKKA